jgi:hypothetical protein
MAWERSLFLPDAMEREPHPITIRPAEVGDAGEVLSARAAIEMVRAAVAGWEGVTTHDHRFGGIEFRLGRRELGHLHVTIADLPFPRRVRDERRVGGQARPHHVLPQSGWVTVPMRTSSEVSNVIELFRQNYERGR